jgi:uncharacterized SAM-binding protein YcdF (DUF218 family)
MPPRRRRGALILIVLLLVLAAGGVFWRPLLVYVAEYPNIGQEPVKADAVLVLAGGWHGERILKAGELVRAGFAPYALVSSPSTWYETPECDGAKRLAARRGYEEASFICVPVDAHSTREEAAQLAPAVRERKIRRLLLVSVSTHLRRATTLMREAAPEVTIVPVAAQPVNYDPARWWAEREGRKALFNEWLKLLTGPFGI